MTYNCNFLITAKLVGHRTLLQNVSLGNEEYGLIELHSFFCLGSEILLNNEKLQREKTGKTGEEPRKIMV